MTSPTGEVPNEAEAKAEAKVEGKAEDNKETTGAPGSSSPEGGPAINTPADDSDKVNGNGKDAEHKNETGERKEDGDAEEKGGSNDGSKDGSDDGSKDGREEREARSRLIQIYKALNEIRGRDDKLEELMREARKEFSRLKAAGEFKDEDDGSGSEVIVTRRKGRRASTSSSWCSSRSPSLMRRPRRRGPPPPGVRPINLSFEAPKSYSISEFNFIEWSKINRSMMPATHYAIDIPMNEPTPDDLAAMIRISPGPPRPQGTSNSSSNLHSSRSATEASDAHSDAGSKKPSSSCDVPEPEQGRDPLSAKNLEEQEKLLPERIRINSGRLKAALDFESETLPFGVFSSPVVNPWSSAFTILRPFKRLVFWEDKLRGRLEELETARRNIRDATEEEYEVEYKKENPNDWTLSKWPRNLSTLTVPVLTGFIKDLRLLIRFIDEYIKPMEAKAVSDQESFRFCDLWYLYRPGTLVYIKDKKIPQKVFRVVSTTGGRRRLSRPAGPGNHPRDFTKTITDFVMDCFHVDYNGTRYVAVFKRFGIKHFEGTQQLTSFLFYPFHLAERLKQVNREELQERGLLFKECTTLSHRYYDGRSHYRAPKGDTLVSLLDGSVENYTRVSAYSERISSEVMVDFERALDEIPEWRPGEADNQLLSADVTERGNSIFIDHDETWDVQTTDTFFQGEIAKSREWEKAGTGPMEEVDLIMLPDRVFAFILRTRKWACISIGKNNDGEAVLRDIIPRTEPWNNLELPEGHKDIVQSLIESHFSKNKAYSTHFDLVRDKGKGVIILLHGVPGVGKTSTAECTAESYNRPLLPITCGDLGLTPREVEKNLQTSFQLAQAWDCIMLLDEADVFLTTRNVEDTTRNALVSVFLRVLEYYEGILFLTTNRVGSFDEAFKSRIHVSLYYPPLDINQTRKIWKSHIHRATEGGHIKADEAELLRFAEALFEQQTRDARFGPIWNGRQIRNAFQSAVALAGFRTTPGEPLTLHTGHFDKVSRVSSHFNEYLWKVNSGRTDADAALTNRLRMDNFTPSPMSFGGGYGGGGTAVPSTSGLAPQYSALQQTRITRYGQSHDPFRPVTPTGMGGGLGGGAVFQSPGMAAVAAQQQQHQMQYHQQQHQHPMTAMMTPQASVQMVPMQPQYQMQPQQMGFAPQQQPQPQQPAGPGMTFQPQPQQQQPTVQGGMTYQPQQSQQPIGQGMAFQPQPQQQQPTGPGAGYQQVSAGMAMSAPMGQYPQELGSVPQQQPQPQQQQGGISSPQNSSAG